MRMPLTKYGRLHTTTNEVSVISMIIMLATASGTVNIAHTHVRSFCLTGQFFHSYSTLGYSRKGRSQTSTKGTMDLEGAWLLTYSTICIRTYSNYGDRCFAAVGPRLWNSLPADLRQADISFEQFERLLGTFLFGCWDRGAL